MPFSLALFVLGLTIFVGATVASKKGDSPEKTRFLSACIGAGAGLVAFAILIVLWQAWFPLGALVQPEVNCFPSGPDVIRLTQ